MSAFQAPPGMQSPIYGADFSAAVVRVFRKAVVFVGRASRSEYWWGLLALFLADILISIIQGIIVGPSQAMSSLLGTGLFAAFGNAAALPFELASILLIIPQLSLAFRRLHDANYSGWYGLVILIPFIGLIALIAYGFMTTVNNVRYENSV